MRWRFGLLLIVAVLVGRVRSEAQPLPSPPDDAGVVAPPATNTGGAMTSGSADADASVAPRPTSAPTLTGGPPEMRARPAPTPQQIENLRLLEAEVDGFLQRGQGFRSSVNGLLSREHDRQLGRLRAGFDRQIQAERAAEGEARRHAIQVFERFLETYPEDNERTPDVMFRLAELYYDESAYARLAAMDVADHRREELRGQGLPVDTVQDPPIDYRCSILLYRHIISRFARFRMSDSTHYLLGWVLKEMGREDEAINAYKGMVCPSRFHYDSAQGLDLAAPLQPSDQPVVCPHLFDMLRPRAPELVSPAPPVVATGGDADAAAAPVVAMPELVGNQTVPIPRDYQQCEPMRGPNDLPSRYAGEVWYYIGDYHFDSARDDEGNAWSIAAYQAAMRASLRPRPVAANRAPVAAIQGAGENTTQMPAAARAQFDAATEYGVFWSKALYKVGWAFFRMQNGYPEALRNFGLLLDYYDYVGTEAATQGNRTDTIKWIGVIFSESNWGTAPSDDGDRCQVLVNQIASPPADAPRPFDCAGILRVVSPADPAQIAAVREGTGAQRAVPVPGRPTYIAQDRPWTPEAYLELADDYYQQTKYYEAITLYRLFLALYPLHERAPRVAVNIVRAYEQQRQFDRAIDSSSDLSRYTEGGAWWNANNNHPDAQRYADTVARNSLHDTALQHHQEAGRLRQQALSLAAQARGQTGAQQAQTNAEVLEKLRRADAEYRAAVQAYSHFVENYPNDEAAYEFRYNRADALYWSRNYQEAARAYTEVRESNENDQYMAASAYMAVKSQEAFVRAEAQRRALDPCLAARAGIPVEQIIDEGGSRLLTPEQATTCTAPPATGATVTELNIPAPVQALMDTRLAYSNRVPASLDNATALADVVVGEDPGNSPPFRPKFAYLNARTLLRFGHVAQAESLYLEILNVYCTDATVAGASFADLNNLYVTQNRQAELDRLVDAQQARRCEGVSQPEIDRYNLDRRFRDALNLFRQAERAPAGEANALYERAAHDMEEAVNSNRTHPQAALATYYVALAYERTGKFDTATRTYQRIANDYNNTRDSAGHELAGEDLTQRINILEVSNFRAAVNLERIFDYDSSIRYYGTVVSDARFANAAEHTDHVHDSLVSIATINTNLGRWEAARTAWQNFIPRAASAQERAEAEFRAAEMPFRASNWAGALTSLQDYLRRTPSTPETAQYRVRAQYNIALAQRSLGSEANYRRALREVVTVFRASGQQPGSPAAAWAAEALFRDLDDQVNAFTRVQFQQGDATALRAQVDRFKEQLRAIDAAARDVVALRGGEYSIGALTRQGEAHEYLATQEVRVGSLIQLSAAQQRQFDSARRAIQQLRTAAEALRRAGRDEQAQALEDRANDLETQLNDQIAQATQQVQESFDREAEAERSLAIINYGTAVHTARSQNLPTPYASRALEHMRSEENRPLVDRALGQQRVFEYRQGMFDGEAPGATVSQTTPLANPGLVGE